MLMVRVELWPGGRESMKRELAKMAIGNTSDLADVSNYDVGALEEANALIGTGKLECRFQIKDHQRRQTVWALVAVAAEMASTLLKRQQRREQALAGLPAMDAERM